ncbi:MAG: ribosomal protein large subunit ribosomal protein [Candidatus Nomurabacteria bacterium]|nr:ribosomal protein large subunit ribosomal protein [Candidatus Nomurabacteria bacterium]
MQVNIYTTEGKKSKTLELPENIFGAKWNADLVAQVVTSQASNRRAGTAHTKNRAEVRGSHKKPWAQKGSGRARHGSAQSPLWKGGGVTFGPRNEKSYKKTITKSMRSGALFSLLSAKLKAGKIIFVESVPSVSKTKDADVLMKGLTNIEGFKTLTYKKPNNVYMTVQGVDAAGKRAFRNLPYMTLHNVEDLNPLDIANSRYLVIANPEESIKYLSSKLK